MKEIAKRGRACEGHVFLPFVVIRAQVRVTGASRCTELPRTQTAESLFFHTVPKQNVSRKKKTVTAQIYHLVI